MGCSSPQNAFVPNVPQSQLNRLLQVSQIGHPLNVNKKYEHLVALETSQEVGSGYRKTYAYRALTTKQDLEAQKNQFWETRTSGQPVIWQQLRKIANAPTQAMGEQLIRNNRLYMLNGTIQMCLDSKYNKYQVPVFCINTPLSYSQHRQQKNLQLEYEEKQLEVTIRSTKYPNGDIKLNQQTSSQIQILKQTLKALKELPDETKVRFFYTGREMKDDKTLGNYNYVPGTVIQAMIT